MTLVTLLIYLLVLAIIAALAYYILDALPIPEPINRIIKLAVVVIVVVAIVILLLNLVGHDLGVRVN